MTILSPSPTELVANIRGNVTFDQSDTDAMFMYATLDADLLELLVSSYLAASAPVPVGVSGLEAVAQYLQDRDEALGPTGPYHTEAERLESAAQILALVRSPPPVPASKGGGLDILRKLAERAGAYALSPWKASPWHVEEGPSAVRVADGWIVATTCSDDLADYLAAVHPKAILDLLDLIALRSAQPPAPKGGASVEVDRRQIWREVQLMAGAGLEHVEEETPAWNALADIHAFAVGQQLGERTEPSNTAALAHQADPGEGEA